MTLAVEHARAFVPGARVGEASLIDDATIVLESGRIRSVVPSGAVPSGARRLDAGGRLVTPGLVDAHTHSLFLGDRSEEFCARAAGVSYLELAKRGGGIRATVGPTRDGTRAQRLERARARLRRLARQGVTTVEAKTGYGLSVATELLQLEELALLNGPGLPRVRPTLLAAHALPPEIRTADERAAWIREIAEVLIPEAARRRLAGRVDVFVEENAYTADEARRIAKGARAAGLALHLHVDQLSEGGGAALAAELSAQAAAHLERVSPAGIAALAASRTVAMLLPTATLAAREPGYAPARRLVEAGVPIALATNLNPGTAPSESTALVFFLAAVGLGLTPEEILWAFTRGGALALGEDDLGRLEPGARGDLVVWNALAPSHLPYHAAVNHVRYVLQDGEILVDRAEADLECDGAL